MITRSDLKPGAQAVQSAHALTEFAMKHNNIFRNWFEISNHIALLSVNNEQELLGLLNKSKELNILCSEFKEPDMKNKLTAICLEPSDKSKELCSHLTLALKIL